MIVQTMYEMYDLYRGGNRSPREKIVYFSGPPIRNTLKVEFPDQDNDFMFNEFVRISWDYYAKVVKPFPHAVEVFTKIRGTGVYLGVVTGKYRRQTLHCLDIIGFTPIIDFIVAWEVEDGMNEDLVDVPRVEFVDIGTMEYAAKAKKIIDLRENFD